MSKLETMIARVEHFLDCWKQFSHFLNLARFKKYSPEDETEFLEVKSVIMQELELIASCIQGMEWEQIRAEVLTLMTAVPSIRHLSDTGESAQRNVENQWHKLFIGWQSILGRLKVQQKETDGRSWWSSLVGRPA